jgi:protein involved in polysaccharide export with SLBB domain
VFSLNNDAEDPFSRTVVTTSLLEELSRQANIDAPFERVTVSGEVLVPGVYPFEPGMRASDLIRAGGTLTEAAFRDSSEMTRYSVVGRKERISEVINLDINAVLAGDPEHDILLNPGDFLTIRRIQDWDDQTTVFLDGEVRYPGTYSFYQGETLLSVIERAGGLTDHAFPEGSIFLREALREREQQQLAALRERLRSDIASLSLQAATSLESTSVVEAKSVGTALLASLTDVEAAGRLVIDLPALLQGESRTGDVLLQHGDQLLIPKTTQSVTVIGEVQFATSHLYDPGLKRNDYINRSGGLAPNASKKTIYVVRANGAVIANKSAWGGSGGDIQPGDTVVVPLDTQRGLKLQAWASITNIAYNAAIAVAAINGLD